MNSLGSARFLKTVKCRHRNGYMVVKIFIKPDPGLSLRSYHRRLKSVLFCPAVYRTVLLTYLFQWKEKHCLTLLTFTTIKPLWRRRKQDILFDSGLPAIFMIESGRKAMTTVFSYHN
jgi:hypothetical protein